MKTSKEPQGLYLFAIGRLVDTDRISPKRFEFVGGAEPWPLVMVSDLKRQ